MSAKNGITAKWNTFKFELWWNKSYVRPSASILILKDCTLYILVNISIFSIYKMQLIASGKMLPMLFQSQQVKDVLSTFSTTPWNQLSYARSILCHAQTYDDIYGCYCNAIGTILCLASHIACGKFNKGTLNMGRSGRFHCDQTKVARYSDLYWMVYILTKIHRFVLLIDYILGHQKILN